jgi:hypothetical protein
MLSSVRSLLLVDNSCRDSVSSAAAMSFENHGVDFGSGDQNYRDK